jgi:imidazolonepropionase-like amidohydrolase
MNEAGMPAMKTIQAATIVNATILEMDKQIGESLVILQIL